jgi:acetyl-CoA acetyltransferase family protein
VSGVSRPVIVSAVRTAIGTAYKGTLVDTPPEDMASVVVQEAINRSGLDASRVDDVILAQSLYGGGDLARYVAVVNGMTRVPGLAVNRHCAGSLAAVGIAAAGVASDMEDVVVAGGVQSTSLSPQFKRRAPGTTNNVQDWFPLTHPETADAPNFDMSISVGWNTAQAAGLTREEIDAWAFRSHQRAVAAIDGGKFLDEIVPIKARLKDGAITEFAVDEHPRRNTSMETMRALRVLHPEIPNFSITAGNASGANDAAAALTITSASLAHSERIDAMARIRAWAAVGVEPRNMGFGAIWAIEKVLDRAGLNTQDIELWEINEAFASVPLAACRELGLDEDLVNVHGSGCSLGHPIAASGARMLTTLIYELRRRGGGRAVAAMCAGGGQGGAVVIEV